MMPEVFDDRAVAREDGAMTDEQPRAVSVDDGTGRIWWTCQVCSTVFGPYDEVTWPQTVLDHDLTHAV